MTSQQITQDSQILQTVSRQKTEAFPEEKQRVSEYSKQGIVLTNQATQFKRITDVAGTIMARDWKGFGNQEMVGVLESE